MLNRVHRTPMCDRREASVETLRRLLDSPGALEALGLAKINLTKEKDYLEHVNKIASKCQNPELLWKYEVYGLLANKNKLETQLAKAHRTVNTLQERAEKLRTAGGFSAPSAGADMEIKVNSLAAEIIEECLEEAQQKGKKI